MILPMLGVEKGCMELCGATREKHGSVGRGKVRQWEAIKGREILK
jgi:hypothetical protein